MTEPLVHEEVKIFEEEDDLSYWEFINTSDIDQEEDADDYEYSEYKDSLYNGFGSWQSWPSTDDKKDCQCEEDQYDHDGENGEEEEEGYEEQSEEDEYDDDVCDLDDELVPWTVSDRFGKQRMRKLGKRGYAKMNKSKKLAYTRPGCVHGKHGLGLKHN